MPARPSSPPDSAYSSRSLGTEHLGGGPAHEEETECPVERRADSEGAHAGVDDAELDRTERGGEPAGLIRHRAVVQDAVEHEPHREHQRDKLDRPPAMQRERDDECR